VAKAKKIIKKKLKKDLEDHFYGDMKGFADEIEGDKKTIRGLKKGKISAKKIKGHFKDDIAYYKKEADQDKKLLKRVKKATKKSASKKPKGLVKKRVVKRKRKGK